MSRSAKFVALVTTLALGIVVVAIGAGRSLDPFERESGSITLHGAAQLSSTHSYNRGLVRFAELVEAYYSGPLRLNFVLHENSELGLEKDYFGYMNIGAVVDYAIVSPSHASTFSKAATIMDVPFLFDDYAHFQRAIDANVFGSVEQVLRDAADVETLGYGGGESRHFFGKRPVRTVEELSGFVMRVMGSPIQSRMYEALGATPTVISMSEIYNAIQTGVIDGAENSASALDQAKFYEVGGEVSISTVSVIVRPLLFSGKRLRKLPPDLQEAIRKAGREAAAFERQLEQEDDWPLMEKLAAEGKVRLHQFEERDELLRMAEPVKEAFAREIGAEDILAAINGLRR